jgi:hypothetical protein
MNHGTLTGVCAHINDPEYPMIGDRNWVTCVGEGRYLIIQLQHKDFLTLCEVEAMDDKYREF